jgi:tetratricopeptide (TPR) repeat protein
MAGREDIFKKAMNEGHSAAWDQQWDKAASAYQKALDEFPNEFKALTSLGLAFFELRQFPQALEVYKRAIQAAPGDPLPLEKAGQISEQLNNSQDAIQAYMKAAELYIKSQDADKALENWVRVTQLDPGNINARSYLAMVHERLGHTGQAATEYLAIASLMQHSGSMDKAVEMVGRALKLSPNSQEARQAQSILNSGQLLPKPMRPQGGTGPLRSAQVKQIPAPKSSDSGLDPVADTARKALARLAEVLFELSDSLGDAAPSKRGNMQSIVRGTTGSLNLKPNDPTRIVLHIGQAVDAQTKGQNDLAAEELDKAMAAGFNDPALYYELGMLRAQSERTESALRHLQIAVKNEEYALGARLVIAEVQQKQGRLAEAVSEYMEALKIADSSVVPPDQGAEMRQMYEPLIEAVSHESQKENWERLCENIRQLLVRPGWQAAVLQAREQLPKSVEGMPPIPLADVLAQAQSGLVIEAVGRVRQMAREGHLRSAMDEAFDAFKQAPTYLPLHTLVGDLLIQDGRTQDAIAKYTVVASAYNVRGEAAQAINLLRRIVKVAPMDMAVRTRLIDLLTARGQIDEAIGEYIDLADIYYRLAELDLARKTYTTALRQAQQGGANRAWTIKLLQRMADIDMQRLDWRQALRVFEQLRTLEPEDLLVRENLIDLNNRLNQPEQAAAELDNCLNYLQNAGRSEEALILLEGMVKGNPQYSMLRRALAEEYRRQGRTADAIAQLDMLGETLLTAGDKAGALQAIESIIALAPENVDEYRQLLAKIQSEN